MSAVFLMTGNCTLGRTQTDHDGNVVESTPAQFTADDAGSCVAVGLLDPKTMQPVEPVTGIYGNWDAAGYLTEVLMHLKPARAINIPDIKAIVQAAYREDGNDLLCDYCNNIKCPDCIIRQWKDEVE